MAVLENISQLNGVLEQVKTHCMCLYFHDNPSDYTVQFPAGYQVDGCRVSKGMGKIKALETMIDKMNLYWKGV